MEKETWTVKMAFSNLAQEFNTALPSQWLGAAVAFVALVLFVRSIRSWNQKRPEKTFVSQTPLKVEKAFTTPLPEPLLDFDPDAKTPKLYRPFRHGPNYVTMGIRKLDWNNWIEMDSYFLRYHDLKASELKKDFDGHIKYVDQPPIKDACFELYDELARYLTHRYPKIFNLKDGILRNSLTNEEFCYPASTFSLEAHIAPVLRPISQRPQRRPCQPQHYWFRMTWLL
jgi:hypothetical protein